MDEASSSLYRHNRRVEAKEEPISTRVVGFEDDAMKIMERLMGQSKQLDIISIVGMPGLGKTTLALKVYHNPSIAHYFYIRAWISVSQVYRKKDLLLGLLSSPYIPPVNGIHLMGDEKLSETLYKCLKGNRYLIVLDDIWNTEALDDLKIYFPNDNNGSRIMITSRERGVALHAKPGSIPHDLRFLSGDQSWDLLQEKVFNREKCPQELMEFGKSIAEKCRGLPLTIVVVGGLLAKTQKTKHWWKQVGENITSYTASVSKTLELSYNHLPDHLKPLFLYFGAFPEDCAILVSKLIWLWMAEGFVKKCGDETLEDFAERYLMDLIERNLILIANRTSNGGVKSCRIHDLLRDFCLRKAEEENFMQTLFRYDQLSFIILNSSSSHPNGNKLNRLSTSFEIFQDFPFEHYPDMCSLLVFDRANFHYKLDFQHFKLLRVLDFSHGIYQPLPSEIEQLVHMRYLALYMPKNNFTTSICKLRNLETLVYSGLPVLTSITDDIFTLSKLRHLHLKASVHFPLNGFKRLASLQTLSTPIFTRSTDRLILESTPNLRKLRCIFFDIFSMPRGLEFLVNLEKLSMHFNDTHRMPRMPRMLTPEIFMLPASLKHITLSKFRFDWREISKLARLPNLEVLKLVDNAFKGELWDTSFVEYNFQPFPKLKFLKFESLNIKHWNACTDHLPSLQRLVLNGCDRLNSIPSDLGDIPTLEMIELNCSSQSSVDSAWKILKEQRDNGNEQLEVFVYPSNLSPTSYRHRRLFKSNMSPWHI